MGAYRTLKFVTCHPLNRHQRLRSLARFAKWQIASRLISADVVFPWINGAKFLVRKGEVGLTGNVYAGLEDFSDMAFLLHFLRATDLFVDVGANVGSYTILACGVTQARGYAFEPVPTTYSRLMANLRLNQLEDRVTCRNIGISRAPGNLTFTADLNTVNHALAVNENSANAITVEVLPLDSVLHDLPPSLIKIDVEGYETPVLDGATQVLQQPTLKAVIMELNGSASRYGYDETRLLGTMLDHGFGTFAYDPFARVLIDLKGKHASSGNTIFVRDTNWVLERLRSSPPISVNGNTF